MSLSPIPSTVSRDLSSLLGDRHGLADDPRRGIAVLAALGGYLANELIVRPARPAQVLMLRREIRDPRAEEAVNALIQAVARASQGPVELTAFQTWAIAICSRRKPGPSGKPLGFHDGRRRLVRRLRRLVAIANRNVHPRTVCVLRGLASSARILGAMGWLPAPAGPLFGLAFEVLADGGNAALRESRPSLGLMPAALH